jgi:hypothetical protein
MAELSLSWQNSQRATPGTRSDYGRLEKEPWWRVEPGLYFKTEFQLHHYNNLDIPYLDSVPEAGFGSPQSFALRVDTLDFSTAGDDYILGKTSEKR